MRVKMRTPNDDHGERSQGQIEKRLLRMRVFPHPTGARLAGQVSTEAQIPVRAAEAKTSEVLQ